MGERAFSTGFFPIVVAHRGASATHAENTLEAIDAALAAGAQAVEMDVRLTADGHPVVLHDPDVARISGDVESATPVADLTLADLAALDLSGGLGAGARVPTLEQALDALAGRATAVLEIKNWPHQPGFDPDHGQAEVVLAALSRAAAPHPALVVSFNWPTLDRVLELDPRIGTGLLLASGTASLAEALAHATSRGHAFILPQADLLLAEGSGFVGSAHSSGVRVGTWVVDEPAQVAAFFAWGVDAVATNDPAMAVPLRPEPA